MKHYRETYIRKAEIAQLIILNQLYSRRGSRDLIFQGGTALRWCYGGNRFSEDLDFVTPLTIDDVHSVLRGALKTIERIMIAHFGNGVFETKEKQSRTDSCRWFLNFRPEEARGNISVKFEVEGLASGMLPRLRNHVLSGLPAVAYLISSGDFRVPRPNAVVVAETPEEILSDKVRALLERPYLKGRDFFDVWYIRNFLKASTDIEVIENTLKMYRMPFTAQRSMNFFIDPSLDDTSAMQTAIEQDLSRFLPSDVLETWRADNFKAFIIAVQSLFRELKEKGMRLS